MSTCEYCYDLCKKCFENDIVIACNECGIAICYNCIIPTNIYNDKIAEYVFNDGIDDVNTYDTKKYRKVAWPDVGYICNSCYKLKRSVNIIRIMNGLLTIRNKSI